MKIKIRMYNKVKLFMKEEIKKYFVTNTFYMIILIALGRSFFDYLLNCIYYNNISIIPFIFSLIDNILALIVYIYFVKVALLKSLNDSTKLDQKFINNSFIFYIFPPIIELFLDFIISKEIFLSFSLKYKYNILINEAYNFSYYFKLSYYLFIMIIYILYFFYYLDVIDILKFQISFFLLIFTIYMFTGSILCILEIIQLRLNIDFLKDFLFIGIIAFLILIVKINENFDSYMKLQSFLISVEIFLYFITQIVFILFLKIDMVGLIGYIFVFFTVNVVLLIAIPLKSVFNRINLVIE